MSTEEDLLNDKTRKEAIPPPGLTSTRPSAVTAVQAPADLPSAPVIPGFVNGKVAKRAEDMKTNRALKPMTVQELLQEVQDAQ